MTNDLVSIIMLSKDNGLYIRETIESVLTQTYENWELIFLDDKSKDDTISQMMDYIQDKRFKVSQNSQSRGDIASVNAMLKDARGRWIAFLNVGDIWAPEKLEKQVAFMEKHGYAFSYHQYRLMDSASKDRGFLCGGKEHVTYNDMQKCCWPAYLTVMYDAEKVGKVNFRSDWTNYYALWMNVSENHNCYLLPENLATLRTKWGRLGKILLTNNIRWRYDVYRLEKNYGRFKSLMYTIRNMWHGLVKWWKYVKRE